MSKSADERRGQIADVVLRYLEQEKSKLTGALIADKFNSPHLSDEFDRLLHLPGFDLVASYYGPSSGQHTACAWLNAFNWLVNARAAVPPDLTLVVELAEECGRRERDLWLRLGRYDQKTGHSVEALALGKQRQHAGLTQAAQGRRQHAADIEPEWRDPALRAAEDFRARFPSYSRWRIAGELCGEYGRSQKQVDRLLKKSGFD
jgi:hypothetical protein